MQSGYVVWITGLAGAGKTTISQQLYLKLKNKYSNVVLIDGDVFRKIFREEKDFSLQGRLKVAKKIAALCSFLSENGLIVICATISLFNEIYKINRQNITNYFEIFVECDFKELLKRDKKNLYTLAMQGKIKDVIGVDLQYDKPTPHCIINNSDPKDLATNIDYLYDRIETFLMGCNKDDDVNYWEHYYDMHLKSEKESPFANFCMENFFNKKQDLIELGCGNGRDSIYFAKNRMNVVGIDQCENIINFLRKNYTRDNLVFEKDDFTNLANARKYDVVYSRFTLHSITYLEQIKVFSWVESVLRKNGLFCIEARGIRNSLYRIGIPLKDEEDAFIHDSHFRRFLKIERLIDDLKKEFNIIYSAEDKGFAPIGKEDDYFIRVIAQKV